MKANSEATKAPILIIIVRVEGLLPFTTTIMDAPMPRKSTSPTFEKYNGSTDLVDHLRSFVNAMAFYSLSDPDDVHGFFVVPKGGSTNVVQHSFPKYHGLFHHRPVPLR